MLAQWEVWWARPFLSQLWHMFTIYSWTKGIYTDVTVTKRLIDIDDELLAAAQQVLGASTMAETVREALRRLAKRDPGDEYVRLLASLEPTERDVMWRE